LSVELVGNGTGEVESLASDVGGGAKDTGGPVRTGEVVGGPVIGGGDDIVEGEEWLERRGRDGVGSYGRILTKGVVRTRLGKDVS